MPFVQEAPVIFVVGGDPEIAWARDFDRHSSADVDASIAVTHMMLEIRIGFGHHLSRSFRCGQMG